MQICHAIASETKGYLKNAALISAGTLILGSGPVLPIVATSIAVHLLWRTISAVFSRVINEVVVELSKPFVLYKICHIVFPLVGYTFSLGLLLTAGKAYLVASLILIVTVSSTLYLVRRDLFYFCLVKNVEKAGNKFIDISESTFKNALKNKKEQAEAEEQIAKAFPEWFMTINEEKTLIIPEDKDKSDIDNNDRPAILARAMCKVYKKDLKSWLEPWQKLAAQEIKTSDRIGQFVQKYFIFSIKIAT